MKPYFDSKISDEELREYLNSLSQSHVLDTWDALSATERSELISQIGNLDPQIFENKDSEESRAQITPPDAPETVHSESIEAAKEYLSEGKIAVLTVAGGQASRLGQDQPKGFTPASPVARKSLFQLFAEKIRAAQAVYETTFQWLIMTSAQNDSQTRDYFAEHDFWGLDSKNVHFFIQGELPCTDLDGKLLMTNEGKSLLSAPDGHGGLVAALGNSGLFDLLDRLDLRHLSYHQVDNPLTDLLDPAFVGAHLSAESDFSSKCVPKSHPNEKVGLFCLRDKHLGVVEYTELESIVEGANMKLADFSWANIAVHLISTSLLKRAFEGGYDFLPLHKAKKSVRAFIHGEEQVVEGHKFERFIFDLLPHARNPILMAVDRAEAFAPIKNAEGADTPQTSATAQSELFMRWFRRVGVDVEAEHVEVSPLFAATESAFAENWKSQTPIPQGNSIYVDQRGQVTAR